MKPKFRIVILGAGFGGLNLALNLAKQHRHQFELEIILIDKRSYHLFIPNLYAVATGAEELVSMQDLKKSVALNFSEILHHQAISFELGEVKEVDESQKIVKTANKVISYDYLVLAMGSEASFLNVPGAKQVALPLKNLSDALRIKNAVEFALELKRADNNKRQLVIMVAGGGYAGTEIACELCSLLDFLAWKYHMPRQQIEVQIVESGDRLVKSMGVKSSEAVGRRLDELKVAVKTNSRIQVVREHQVVLDNQETLDFDVLIWTVGIAGVTLPQGLQVTVDKNGKVITDSYLRAQNKHDIFVIGDLAKVLYKDSEVPASAQDAIHEAKYLSRAIMQFAQNQMPKIYQPKNHGFILAIGRQHAILNIWPLWWQGKLAYVAHELAQIGYYTSIIGWWKAIKYCCFTHKLFVRKD
jgi:NADH dehydrogenase